MSVLTVKITQEDIDEAMAQPYGHGDWAKTCPMAAALQRRGFNDVLVLPWRLVIEHEKFDEVYEFPEYVQQYLKNIDRTHNPYYKRSESLPPVLPAIFILNRTEKLVHKGD